MSTEIVMDWSVPVSITILLALMGIGIGGSLKRAVVVSVLAGLILYFAPLAMCGSAAFVVLFWFAAGLLGHGPETRDGTLPTFGGEVIDPRHTKAEENDSGTIIGYRYYRRAGESFLPMTERGMAASNRDDFRHGFFRSDRVPTLRNTNGIYAAKTPDSPILENYGGIGTALVKIELSGRVVESEFGYRAQNARIVQVIHERKQ